MKLKHVLEFFPNKTMSYLFCHRFSVGRFTIELQTNDEECNAYIELSKEFKTNATPNFVMTLQKSPSNTFELDQRATYKDKKYFYNYICINETFFRYKQCKETKNTDVILPETYECWSLEHFIKMFISSVSLTFESVLLHASVIIKNSQAFIFTGASGSGKSTIADLSGLRIVHDENVLISKLNSNIFKIETIPFRQNYEKRSFEGEVGGFYSIFQHERTFTKNIENALKLAHLVSSLWSISVIGHDQCKYNQNLLSHCSQLCSAFNISELYFTKSKDFLKVI